MYTRYAERKGWKVELVDSNPPDLGGFKEVVFSVEGDRVYSRLKYESGVHRVKGCLKQNPLEGFTRQLRR